MKPIPAAYAAGPFARAVALADGVSPKMLRGNRFVRLHPRVYATRGHELTWDDLVLAARLALPDRVHLTGISRIQAAGLDFGPRLPVRFVIQGDHHLAIDGIFLHRTKLLPPLDDVGVTLEAAYIFYCARARVIDAIKVGDWLLHHGLIDLDTLEALAVAQLWRPGCNEALWVIEHLDGDSWSLKESETRGVLTFAGLPRPECNQPLELLGVTIRPDLLYRHWLVGVEYEGGQHQRDRDQYVADLSRYELYRAAGHPYVQVTDERLQSPRQMVRRVHRQLVAAGYDGPEPVFGERWRTLFAPLRDVVGPRER
jgi:hypothetical protein